MDLQLKDKVVVITGGAKGIGAVIVPMDRDGVSVTGRHWGMGIHAAVSRSLCARS